MCLPQVMKSFQNYRGVAITFYPTLVDKSLHESSYDNSDAVVNFTVSKNLIVKSIKA